MELLDKSAALYFEPTSIGSPDGARCGRCWKFNTEKNSCLEVDGYISETRGICGLYLNGDPTAHRIQIGLWPARKVSKEEAGYSAKGPTHCGNCQYMMPRVTFSTGVCLKVVGMVDGRGCCNLWEPPQ